MSDDDIPYIGPDSSHRGGPDEPPEVFQELWEATFELQEAAVRFNKIAQKFERGEIEEVRGPDGEMIELNQQQQRERLWHFRLTVIQLLSQTPHPKEIPFEV